MKTGNCSRREFLKALSTAGLGLALAACKPAAAPATTEAVGKATTELPTSTAVPTAIPPTEAPKKVTISLWGWWDTRMKIYDEAGKAFTQENPSIEVKVETIPGSDLNQKLTSSIAAGTNPVLLKMGTNYFKMRDEGLLIEFPDDIFPEGWLKETYPGFDWQTYGRYVTPTGAMPTLLIYNKAMFSEAGLDPAAPPTTWADLITMAQQLTKTEGGQISVCGFRPTEDDYPGLEFVYQVGRIIKSEGGRQVSNWSSPEVKQVYQLFADMVFKYKVWDPGFPSQTESIGTRRAAMTFDESWIIGELKTTYADVYPELGLAVPPTPTGKPEPYYGYKRYVLDLSVLKGRPEEYLPAFKFLEYIQKKRPDVILQLCDISTLVPDRTDLANDPKVTGSEFARLGVQYLLPNECDQVMPPDELWQIVADLVNRICVQGEPVDSALATADEEWQNVLDQGLAKYFVA